jgi:hypothetical protein
MDSSTLTSFETEAIKLAAIGVTIVAASGDAGVSNFNCDCTQSSSSATSPGWSGNSWDGEGYFPTFPASSPWVRFIFIIQHNFIYSLLDSNLVIIVGRRGLFGSYLYNTGSLLGELAPVVYMFSI